MNDFEHQLKSALRRVDPPAGFTERVLARVAQEHISAPRSGYRQWLAAVAALLLFAGTSSLYLRHERVVEGETAKQKLLVAMHIAGFKLQQAQERVQQVKKLELN